MMIVYRSPLKSLATVFCKDRAALLFLLFWSDFAVLGFEVSGDLEGSWAMMFDFIMLVKSFSSLSIAVAASSAPFE